MRKDLSAALRFYDKACFNVGVIYYNGEVTEKDYKTALERFKKACEQEIGCSAKAVLA